MEGHPFDSTVRLTESQLNEAFRLATRSWGKPTVPDSLKRQMLAVEQMIETINPIPRASSALADDSDELAWKRLPGEVVSIGEWHDDPRKPFVYCDVAIMFSDNDIAKERVQSSVLLPSRELIAGLLREAITKLRAWHYIDHHAA